MLRLAICDDMPAFSQKIQDLLNNWENRPCNLHIDIYTVADALLKAHCAAPYDIILLDVVMPLLNGIEAAHKLRQTDSTVRIVFLTSSSEFAVDAFAIRANHYLLKPVEPSMLYRCLNELYHEIQKNAACIVIRNNATIHRILLQEIESVEAHLKHMQITRTDGSTLWSTDPLYYFEEKLLAQKNFIKCHRSYLVNLYHVQTYTKKELIMRSGRQIPISRNAHKTVEETYFSLLFDEN